MSSNIEAGLLKEQQETPKEHWKDYTVGVMSASSNTNFAARENTKAIGRILAKNGFDGANGGYSEGAMKDFADGFREQCREEGRSEDEITRHLHGTIFSDKAIGEGLRNQRGVNDTMSIKEAHTLSGRAGGIIDNSDAIIVAEGGIGTELEGLLAAQGEWFALKKNTQLRKEIGEAESSGVLTDELKQNKTAEMVSVKPAIVIVLK